LDTADLVAMTGDLVATTVDWKSVVISVTMILEENYLQEITMRLKPLPSLKKFQSQYLNHTQ
jgi:predicted regulator of amino acid metabolism with ACT domain